MDDFREKLATTPVDVIPMTDYGMMKGDKVLELAESFDAIGGCMDRQSSIEVAMQLIMYGGEAKSCALEAIAAAKIRNLMMLQKNSPKLRRHF